MTDADQYYVNGRFLSQPVTGVQRFAEQVLRELIRVRPAVTVLLPRGVAAPEWVPSEHITVVGRRRGHVWEQLDLPRYLRRIGSPLLLNLASTAPAVYTNQIVTHHDITYVRFPQSFSPRFRLLYRILVPRFLSLSAAVITVSEFSKREIALNYRVEPHKITVVGNAADSRFTPAPVAGGGRPYFLAVSSLNEHKNFRRLLQAFELAASDLTSDLVIIGARSSAFATQTFATPNASRVRFVGRVDDVRLIELYQHARAFVFPSLYEGFGIPPLEAQQCGIPVASSSAASLPEVLEDSAAYFDPTDVHEMAGVLISLDSDEELRTSLIEKGSSNAHRYSWQASAAQVAQVIDRVGRPA